MTMVQPLIPEAAIEIGRVILDFYSLHCKFDLEAAKDKAIKETALRSLVADAKAWKDRAFASRISFGPARGLWKEWIEPTGILGAIISAVVADDTKKIEAVGSMIAEVDSESKIRRRVQHDQRSRKNTIIVAAAFKHICKHALEASTLGRRWIALRKQMTTAETEFAMKKSEQLVHRLLPLCESTIKSMNNGSARSKAEITGRLSLYPTQSPTFKI